MNPAASPDFDALLRDLFLYSLDISGDRVDAEIRNVQRMFCERLDLDRSSLWQIAPGDPRTLHITHLYEAALEPHAPGSRELDVTDGSVADGSTRVFPTVSQPIPKGANGADYFPWVLCQIVAGSTVVMSSLDDLPPEAARDVEAFRRVGTQANVVVPLRTESGVLGCLSFASTRGARAWPPHVVTQFELVAEVFARALSRKRNSQIVRENAARLEAAAEAANAGLWELDLATGAITATAVAKQIYGFSPDADVTLNQVLEAVHPDDRQMVLDVVRMAPAHATNFTSEYRLLRPDGTVNWVLSSGRASVDQPSGTPARLFGASLNITDRKETEQRLHEALEESTRLREQLKRENVYLRDEIAAFAGSPTIVGRSPAMQRVLAQIEHVAPTASTVLLLGETGTGKGRLAKAIHELSQRRERPMIQVSCSAIPQALIESELFGREKGAYTGALTRQIGRFELAHGSTLFLDEIGELTLEVQVKLLRVLEERRIERLGSAHSIPVDVRIIAATNRDLDAAQRAGTFRSDLFYRLNVFPITLPPLRERPEDIPLLVRTIVEDLAATMGKRVDAIARAQMNALMAYHWPGNIRELRNAVERAMITATGPTLTISVPRAPAQGATAEGRRLEDVERAHIVAVLNQTGWRVRGEQGAAGILGLPPTTLDNRMKKLGIVRPRSASDSART